jgi:hypothetical protein
MLAPLTQSLSKPGFVRVRLAFATPEPISEASLFAARHLDKQGPYHEAVHVLMVAHTVHSHLGSYDGSFAFLKAHNVVPKDAWLTGAVVEFEPSDILAYVIEY